MSSEDYPEFAGTMCQLEEKRHRVTVDRDFPVCENDVQTVLYKDGWLAQVGRMVWEQLQVSSCIDFGTVDISLVIRDVQATKDAILLARDKAHEDLVEMNERYERICRTHLNLVAVVAKSLYAHFEPLCDT